MAAWSIFARSASQNLKKICIFPHKCFLNNVIVPNQRCTMSSEMIIVPSKWQWHKTKDLINFYIVLMALPLSIITIYANVFVGPATLTEIPDGYEPKHWEYYKHPISRFLSYYFHTPPQKSYEKNLHVVYVASEIHKIRQLEHYIRTLQYNNQDMTYPKFEPFFRPHHRLFREYYQKYWNEPLD